MNVKSSSLKLRVRKHWRWGAAGAALVAVVVVSIYGVTLAKITKLRHELRQEYRQLMYDGIRLHYITCSELPQTASQVAFHSPELLGRCGAANVDFQSMEAQGFIDAQPISKADIAMWSEEIQRIQIFLEQKPSIEDKLRLAFDPTVDPLVLLRLAAMLQSRENVPEELLADYMKAAFETRRLKLSLPTAGERELLRVGYIQEIKPADDAQILASEVQLSEAISGILGSIGEQSHAAEWR